MDLMKQNFKTLKHKVEVSYLSTIEVKKITFEYKEHKKKTRKLEIDLLESSPKFYVELKKVFNN